MAEEVQRNEEQRSGAERHRDPLEPAEAAGRRRGEDHAGREQHRDQLGHAEVPGRQGDPDELGDQGQCVQDEQVGDLERAPEPSEPLDDQPGVSDPGDRAEPQHHLLVHVEHGDQQQQGPQQPGAVVLPGLPVGGERPGVVVSAHHDQPGAHDGQQRLQLGGQAGPRSGIVGRDGPERAADVADARVIDGGGTSDGGHYEHPFTSRDLTETGAHARARPEGGRHDQRAETLSEAACARDEMG